MKIPITKMQAQGNDFIILDTVKYKIPLSKSLFKQLAQRQFGIGCDQILILSTTTHQQADFNYQIFNQDGSESSQCGNGARCLGEYIQSHHDKKGRMWRVLTHENIITIRYIAEKTYACELAIPRFMPQDIPSTLSYNIPQWLHLSSASGCFRVSLVNVGNPHAIVLCKTLTDVPLEKLSIEWNQAGYFPKGINISAMQRINQEHIRLSTYERGVGSTLACGSAACAAAISAQLHLDCHHKMLVSQRGGDVEVWWQGLNTPVILQGKVSSHFETIWDSQQQLLNSSA